MFTLRFIGVVTFVIAVGLAAFAFALQAKDTFPMYTVAELAAFGVLMVALINVVLSTGRRRAFCIGQSIVLAGHFIGRSLRLDSFNAFVITIQTIGGDVVTDQHFSALSVAHVWTWLILSIAAGVYATSVERKTKIARVDARK